MLAVGLSGTAQKDGNGRDRGMKDLTPEQIATLQTKRMTLALDLTESQQSEIQALNLENAKTRKAKMEARRSSAEKVEGEKKARPTSEELYAMQNERLDHQIAQRERMKKILSEEQFKKWEKMGRHKGKHYAHKGQQKKHSSPQGKR